MKMKAIQFTAPNKIEVKELPMPHVPENWALIKVLCAGICGTDLNICAGTHPRAEAPLTMGHEFSGVIEKGTKDFKKGTKVTVYPLISCLKCTPCTTGNKHVCNTLGLFGIDKDGAMAEYIAVPNDQIIKLPENISDRLGALIEPIAVAVHTLRETAFVPGDNALVFGCGTIGLCVALTLKQFGARDIVLAETDSSRITLAKELGFEVINPEETDLNKFVSERTNGDGFDRVYDCAGVAAVANCLLDVVKVKGQIVIVASYKKPTELPLFKGMVKETSIHFVRVYRQIDFEIAAKMAANEPLFEKIITHVLPADKAREGFDLLLNKGTGAIKVMFEF
jgi:2-desacetyl-2-hydroxyethyl bacteriochlorophyllide A dehydrogenase